MAQSAVLLPARLETRFDEVDGVSRMRVILVPDRCWFDRRHGATDPEIDLLTTALRTSGGALVGGQDTPEGPGAASAFAALAGAVGASRALWLAQTFPARPVGDSFGVDADAGPREEGARRTAISGLPEAVEIVAVTAAGAVTVATLTPRSRLVLDPAPVDPALAVSTPGDVPAAQDGPDEWWPQWSELQRAGLAVSISPSPVAASEVQVLYAVGVGTATTSAAVFERHLDAGDLGLLQVGAATNTVAGSPTVDLGRDPESWRALAVREVSAGEQRLSWALAGGGYEPRAVPGHASGDEVEQLHRALVATLFPALGAHTLRENWSASTEAIAEAGRWAMDRLRPDGPVVPIRIGRQPYGVWPVSAWRRWRTDDIEGRAARCAAGVRDALVSAADQSGRRLTVDGASAEELWDLLGRTPTSADYDARLGVPVSIASRIMGDPNDRQELLDGIADTLQAVPLSPIDGTLVPVGDAWPMTLGLVLPRDEGDDGAPLQTGPWSDVDEPDPRSDPAEWIAACCDHLVQAFTDQGLEQSSVGPLSEDIQWWPASLWWRLTVVSGFVALDHALREQAGMDGPLGDADPPLLERLGAQLTTVGPHAGVSYLEFIHGLRALADVCRTLGELAVPAVERSLAGLIDTASYRPDPWLTGAAWGRLERLDEERSVGLYAWVDGPLEGDPGPDEAAGLHLAPSYEQARLAAILRDKSLRDPEHKWDLEVTSSRVRAAVRLADDVRTGAHPAEALGREVERLIGVRTVIDTVRTNCPVRPEHVGRRTCDGLQVLALARDDPAGIATLTSYGVPGATIEAIADLDDVLDAYADLLIAEAVDHAVSGRPEAAAHALDAAAGLAVTPDLRALSTPPRGKSVRTTVFSALPAATDPTSFGSPLAAANPALTSWLAASIGGDRSGPEWTCGVGGEPGITLAELGYHLADALVDDLESVVRLAAGVAPTTAVTLPPAVAALRDEARGVGTRPPASTDLDLGPDAAVAFDRDAVSALMDRLREVRVLATDLRRRLDEADSDISRRSALVDAARWAIPPPLGDADGAIDLIAAVELASSELGARLDATQTDSSSDATAVASHLHRLIGRSVPLARQLERSAIPFDLRLEPTDDDGRPLIDSQWLEVVAAVRPPLAHLDALQHIRVARGLQPLAAASTHPGSPWLRGSDHKQHDVPHLVVAYAPAGVDLEPDQPGQLAWSVVDSFAEVVPVDRWSAGMATRFNAPSAQAPNAILVAVTPVEGEDLTVAAALEAVMEARSTARARMIRQEDLRELSVLSGPWMPGFEWGGFLWQAPPEYGDWR